MTDRIPLDHLTSDALDQLYDRLEFTEGAVSRMRDRAEVAGVRAERAQAAIARVRALHRRNEHTGTCEHCSQRDYPDYAVPSPCPTVQALDEPGPAHTDTTQPGPAATEATEPQDLRAQLRTALARLIDPDDDCMPTLSTDGVGFTWIPADKILDDVMRVLDQPTTKEN